jgi:hypothetical protein
VQVTDNIMHDERSQNASVYAVSASNVSISQNKIVYKLYGVQTANASNIVTLTNNSHFPVFTTAVWTQISANTTNFTESGTVQLPAGSDDTTPPTASFGISNGTVISSPTPITVTASDVGSGVARVYLFVDGVPLGFSDTAPYAFTFDPGRYTAGHHELKALAVDRFANPSKESHVSVRVGMARAGKVRPR